MSGPPGPDSQSDVAPLLSLLLKHPRDAFGSQSALHECWQDLGYTEEPDLIEATREFDRFVEQMTELGAVPSFLPADSPTGPDSLYARDASVVCAAGAVLCRMGKDARSAEPEAQRRAFEDLGIPVLGRIEAPGTLEGGDVTWLDPRTVIVGRGYRTNDDGIRQLETFLRPHVDKIIIAQLPHYRGPQDVFHLMSILSPVDGDLAVVYSPLMPVPLRELLIDHGFELVEVPDEEFGSLGCNVLAIAPRVCLLHEGNPITRDRLIAVGATVHEYSGRAISLPGQGGPTCLTRPVVRGTSSAPSI